MLAFSSLSIFAHNLLKFLYVNVCMWYRNDFCKQELTLNDVAFALEKTHGDGFNFMLRSFARIDKGLGNDGLNLKLQINGINSRLVLALRI